MYEELMKQKDMLLRLNEDVDNLKTFIIGNLTENVTCDRTEEDCLLDTLNTNSNVLEEIMKNIEIINNTIRGGNK